MVKSNVFNTSFYFPWKGLTKGVWSATAYFKNAYFEIMPKVSHTVQKSTIE